MIYDWYPKMVKDNNTLYPDRNPNPATYTNIANDEWALGTKEIRAWSNAANLNMGWYGLSVVSWGLNLMLDNEGGRLHYFAQKLLQITWFTLAAQVAFAVNINVAYVRTGVWFQNAVKNSVSVGSSSVNIDERIWLFNPANVVTGTFDALDADRMNHEQQNWISIFLIAGAMSAVFGPLSDKYNVAVFEKEMAQWEEAYGSEPASADAPAVEAPAEEGSQW